MIPRGILTGLKQKYFSLSHGKQFHPAAPSLGKEALFRMETRKEKGLHSL